MGLGLGLAVLTTAASLGSAQELGPAPPSKRAARWALVRVRARARVGLGLGIG